MKILYAAGRRKYASVQMKRVKENLDSTFEIKTAAFLGPLMSQANWTLNSLLDFMRPNLIFFNSEAYNIYANQIKSFGPDLIISDLEMFSSSIGFELNIPVWQVSPLLLYYGVKSRASLELNKYASLFYIKGNGTRTEEKKLDQMFEKSEKLLTYSHFGDLNLELTTEFQWVRPFYVEGKESKTCQHNIVSISPDQNKKILDYLDVQDDVVLFGPSSNHSKIQFKDINNQIEYACNLKNSSLFCNGGITDYCADAYYNNKAMHIIPDLTEPESTINFCAFNKTSKVLNFNKQINNLLGELL